VSLNHINILKQGGVGVLPTDTLYGLVGYALNRPAIERIYRLKQRTPDKPFIILVSSVDELAQFGVDLTDDLRSRLEQAWSTTPTSIIVPISAEIFDYLDRGTKTLAFRKPNNLELLELLSQTGPLAAPSANPEGALPALTIDEARNYFGDNVDFYVDGGRHETHPSRLIKLENGSVTVLRP
jgi:L-threonylcarbamoyladenylate synthase